MYKSDATKEAEKFVESVRKIFAGRDDLIYQIESSIHDPNVISLSTAGKKDAWVEVTLYNVNNPKELFTPHQWMSFGEKGWDIDTYKNIPASIEFYKRFG